MISVLSLSIFRVLIWVIKSVKTSLKYFKCAMYIIYHPTFLHVMTFLEISCSWPKTWRGWNVFSFYPDVVIHSAMLTPGSLMYSAHGDFSRTKEIKIGTLGLLPATDRNWETCMSEIPSSSREALPLFKPSTLWACVCVLERKRVSLTIGLLGSAQSPIIHWNVLDLALSNKCSTRPSDARTQLCISKPGLLVFLK